MMTYYVMVSLYTKAFIEIEANNPEEAAKIAEDTASLRDFDMADAEIEVDQVYKEEAQGVWIECEDF